LRVALLIGDCPSGACGVGDYARVLASTLSGRGLETEIIEFRRLRDVRLIRKLILDLVHFQYPTAGFGKSLAPQLFSFQHRFVLTAHEFQGTHLLRRLAFYPLWYGAQHVIFTNEINRDYALRWAPWLKDKNSVIPLSTNIPRASARNEQAGGAEVVHFGLIRPNKGIEQFIEFAHCVHAQRLPVSLRIVGSPQAGDGEYLRSIQRLAKGLPVIWDLNLPATAVAERLAAATVAYLPFPDGASERRASLLAAMANGLPVLTTRGANTPSALDGAVQFCASPSAAIAAVKQLLREPTQRKELSANAVQYAQRFTWESIADSHIAIYRRLLSKHANRN
jgi:glycosyltransferase involved in cell wall biosynthesis